MKTAKRKAGEKNLMAATWTKAAKVRRAFKAGRQRQTDLDVDVERAVLECRIVSLNIRRALLDAGIFTAAEDLRIGLVLYDPAGTSGSTIQVVRLPHELAEISAMHDDAVKKCTSTSKPLGVIVRLRDREADGAVSTWMQPWLTGARAAKAAEDATRIFAMEGDTFIVGTC